MPIVIGGSTVSSGQATYSVHIGPTAGQNNSGICVNAIGFCAAVCNTGQDLVAIGTNAGVSNTGSHINAIGSCAGLANLGNCVNSLGFRSAFCNSGSQIIAIGSCAAELNTGNTSSFVGFSAGLCNAGNNVIGLGENSLNENTGNYVFGIGQETLGNALSNVTLFSNCYLPSFTSYASASAALGIPNFGSTVLFYNSTTCNVQGIRS
jgi:hypothetical protein